MLVVLVRQESRPATFKSPKARPVELGTGSLHLSLSLSHMLMGPNQRTLLSSQTNMNRRSTYLPEKIHLQQGSPGNPSPRTLTPRLQAEASAHSATVRMRQLSHGSIYDGPGAKRQDQYIGGFFELNSSSKTELPELQSY